MKYLRAVLGITRRDKIHNDYVRDELEIEALSKSIERNALRWFGHLTRMPSNQQCIYIYIYNRCN